MASVSTIKGTSYTPFATGALTTGSYLTDTTGFNNTSAGMTAMDVRIVGTFGANPSAGTTLQLFLIAEIDGANFPGPPGTSSAQPPANYLVGTYVFTSAATTVVDFYDCPMTLPYPCRLVLFNNSGQTFTISSSTAQPKTVQIA